MVVVETLRTIPLNPSASRVAAEVLAGRPAILHHHDVVAARHLAHADSLGLLPPDA